MKTTRKFISIITIFAVLMTMPLTAYATTKTVSPYTKLTYTHNAKFDGMEIHNGIDVSEHNGKIDWKKVSKKIDFAIIRVGYRGYGAKGVRLKDEAFDTNIKNARANGVKVGIYYYSQALTTAEAIEEANDTLKWLGKYEIDLPIFYDYEFADVSSGRLDSAWSKGTINRTKMTNNALAYMNTIRQAGYDAMIYANRSFLSDNVDHTVITKNGYDIWVADYNTKPAFTGEYSIWQYSAKGRLDGLSDNNGYVDSNFWYGSLEKITSKFDTTDVPDQIYTSSPIQPEIKVSIDNKELVAGSDYYIEYKNNTNIGTATAKIIGINTYTEETPKEISFKIVPDVVEGLAVNGHGTDNILVSWEKNPNANRYRIQVYRSGAWKDYGTTAETEELITGLKPATIYNIRISAYKVINGIEYASPYCKAVKEATIPAKMPNMTYSSNDNSITLKWSIQENASGYQIQKYNTSTQKYSMVEEIASGKTASYKIANLKANSTYQYRIRAFKIDPLGNRQYGAYSNKVTAYTKPLAPTLKSLSKPASKRIKASWSKVSGISGYQVQWSTSSNFSSNYKSEYVTSAKAVTKTIKTAQSNKKYFVRIRSYKTRNSKKYYSKWSNTKNITTK